MDTASSVPNPIMEKEVEMEEAPEIKETEQAVEMEVGVKDERLSDSNLSESKATEISEAQVGKPSRVGGRDFFAGGESAW